MTLFCKRGVLTSHHISQRTKDRHHGISADREGDIGHEEAAIESSVLLGICLKVTGSGGRRQSGEPLPDSKDACTHMYERDDDPILLIQDMNIFELFSGEIVTYPTP